MRLVFLIERDVIEKKSGKRSVEAALGVTSCTPEQASPMSVLRHNRGHWAIENQCHWVLDVVFREDQSRARSGHAVANLGLRHNFTDKKTAVVFTVSDVFNSLRERTHIDTPLLRQDITRRRSSRIAYLGLIYNFGKPTKKPKKEDLPYDNTL